jgi:hypothetical protein
MGFRAEMLDQKRSYLTEKGLFSRKASGIADMGFCQIHQSFGSCNHPSVPLYR